jgi:hypothetical protein
MHSGGESYLFTLSRAEICQRTCAGTHTLTPARAWECDRCATDMEVTHTLTPARAWECDRCATGMGGKEGGGLILWIEDSQDRPVRTGLKTQSQDRPVRGHVYGRVGVYQCIRGGGDHIYTRDRALRTSRERFGGEYA